ncbi:MAG: PQQ-binding-like beta-propeller repeat protein [Bacteroidota bacterium]
MLWSYWLGDPLMSMPTIANGKVFTAYPAGAYGLNNMNQGYNNQGLNQIQLLGNDGEIEDPKDLSDDEIEPNVIQPKQVPDPKTAPTTRLRPTHALAAFDLKTGKILWQKWIDGDVMSAPVAHDDELFVVTFPGTFYKFGQNDGEILAASAARATSAPVIVDNGIFFSKRVDIDGQDATETFATASRQNINAVEEDAENEKQAVYLDAKVQSNSTYKSAAVAEDAGNGFGGGAPMSSGWEAASRNIGQSNVSSLQNFQGARVLNYRGANYSLRGDELVCIGEKGGQARWKIKLEGDLEKAGGFVGTPPLAVNGKLVVATLKGDIVVYEAEGGKELQRYKIGIPIRQQPVVEDGWIYAGTTAGKVVAIDTGDESLTGWPVWGGDAAHSGVPTE